MSVPPVVVKVYCSVVCCGGQTMGLANDRKLMVVVLLVVVVVVVASMSSKSKSVPVVWV